MSKLARCEKGEYIINCDYGVADGDRIDICPLCEQWFRCWNKILSELIQTEVEHEG